MPHKLIVPRSLLPIAGSGWYLCRLTLAPPPQPHLYWVMSPSPYLAAVGPDAQPASVVYQLVVQQGDGSRGETSYFLLEGESLIPRLDRRKVPPRSPFFFLSSFSSPTCPPQTLSVSYSSFSSVSSSPCSSSFLLLFLLIFFCSSSSCLFLFLLGLLSSSPSSYPS